MWLCPFFVVSVAMKPLPVVVATLTGFWLPMGLVPGELDVLVVLEVLLYVIVTVPGNEVCVVWRMEEVANRDLT